MKRFCGYCKEPTARRDFSKQEAVDPVDRVFVGLISFGASEAVLAFTKTKYSECQKCGATTKR